MWKFPDQGSDLSCCGDLNPLHRKGTHLLLFFFFLMAALETWKFLGDGMNPRHSCDLTAAAAMLDLFNHCAGLGIEPASSWILVGFVSGVPQWELRQSDS